MTPASRFRTDPTNVASDPDSPRRDAVRRAESRPGGARYPAQRAGAHSGRAKMAREIAESLGESTRWPRCTPDPARTWSGPRRSSARSWACVPSGSTISATSIRASGRACRSTRSSDATPRCSASGSTTRRRSVPPRERPSRGRWSGSSRPPPPPPASGRGDRPGGRRTAGPAGRVLPAVRPPGPARRAVVLLRLRVDPDRPRPLPRRHRLRTTERHGAARASIASATSER